MGEDELTKGLNDKRTIWQEDLVVNTRNDRGLTGQGPFGKRTKWPMAKMVKDQMLAFLILAVVRSKYIAQFQIMDFSLIIKL